MEVGADLVQVVAADLVQVVAADLLQVAAAVPFSFTSNYALVSVNRVLHFSELCSGIPFAKMLRSRVPGNIENAF